MFYGDGAMPPPEDKVLEVWAEHVDMKYLVLFSEKEEQDRWSDGPPENPRSLDVRHEGCGGGVLYKSDPQDPGVGDFVCESWQCKMRWRREIIEKKWHSYRSEFYIVIPWRHGLLKLADNELKGYTYLRPATDEEVEEGLLEELQKKRARVPGGS